MPPLVVPADGAVQLVSNGRTVRMLMQADGSSWAVFNRAPAEQFGYKPGWISIVVRIASVRIKGWTAVVRYMVDGQQDRRRVFWFERDIAPGFAGMLGPGSVPQEVVTFQLRPRAANERPYALPMVERAVLGMGTMAGDVFVQFDPQRRQSIGTASAGASLAKSQGGAFTGAWLKAPVRFGVERPVRMLALDRPLGLGPVALAALLIRVQDYGSTTGIPDKDADPDEIVVAAKAGKKDRDYRVARIGADALSGCSSITFDKPRKQILLSCQA